MAAAQGFGGAKKSPHCAGLYRLFEPLPVAVKPGTGRPELRRRHPLLGKVLPVLVTAALPAWAFKDY